MYRTKKILLFALLTSLASIGMADENKYRGHLGIIGKVGTERTIGRVDLMLPIVQSDKSLLFLDVRGVFSTKETQEGNFGLGYRQQLENAPWILGGYVFYDVIESENNNTFHHMTLGIEALGEKWTARANGYIALSGSERISGNDEALAQGNKIIVSEGFERPLHGIDAEIGRTIDPVPGLSGFFGAYHFDNSGVGNISGFRGRVEFSLSEMWAKRGEHGIPILNKLTLTGEVQHDNERDTSAFLGINYIVPFGKAPNKPLSRLERRMTEMVIRDIDVVINENTVINNASNQLGDELTVWHVDNTSTDGGDGSFENPFNVLKDAENASAPYDLIHVRFGDGMNTNQSEGFILKKGQTLHGQGVDLTAVLSDGTLTSVKGLEMQGHTVINNQSSVNAVVLADDATVKGISASNSLGNGLLAENVNNFVIQDVIVSGNEENGIQLLANASGDIDLTATLNDLLIEDNLSEGLRIEQISSNGRALGTVSISNATILNNNQTTAVTNGELAGLFYSTAGDTNHSQLNLSNIIANTTRNGNGVRLFSRATNTNHSRLNIENLIAQENDQKGLIITSEAQQENYAEITMNNIDVSSNRAIGLELLTSSDRNMTRLNADTIVANDHEEIGIFLLSNADSYNESEIILKNFEANRNKSPSSGNQVGLLVSTNTFVGDNNTDITLIDGQTNDNGATGVFVLRFATGGDLGGALEVQNIESVNNSGNGAIFLGNAIIGNNHASETYNRLNISDNGGGGVRIEVDAGLEVSANLAINNLIAENNGFSSPESSSALSLSLVGDEITSDTNILIENTRANNNALSGLNIFHDTFSDSQSNTTIRNTVTNGNGQGLQASGLQIFNQASTSGTNSSIVMLENVISNDNTGSGIFIQHEGAGSDSQVSLDNIQANSNIARGLRLANIGREGNTAGVISVRNSTFENNKGLGGFGNRNDAGIRFDLTATGTQADLVTLENNTIRNHRKANATDEDLVGIFFEVFADEITVFVNEVNIFTDNAESQLLEENTFFNNDINIDSDIFIFGP